MQVAEIQAIQAENQRLLAENTAIKQDVTTFKKAVMKTLVEFGVVNEKMEALKVNKFKLIKKVGAVLLSAFDGEQTSFFNEVIETAKPLIEKYQDL